MGQVQPKHRRAKANLDQLRIAGATAATFHPDGSIASVTFAAVVAAPVAPAVKSQGVEEVLSRPYPKTDLDGLDDLPAYDAEAN